MKYPRIITLALLSTATIATAAPTQSLATPKKPPTHADLVKLKAAQDKAAPPAEPAKPIAKAKRKTLIGSSTLLANNGHWTLIPKGAVIYIPERHKGKLVSKPTGTLIEWKKFLIANHGWIHVHPVTMTQAQGKDKLADDVMKAYQSMGKVVVATCAGGPISVAPISLLTEEETAELKAKAAATGQSTPNGPR
ncbi:hypothetical protein JIN77_06500 [Verrucomicrobiaceae bacterium R5-34]|nr:hypothetical protein [Verrucomicrobiaceae bacterium R5-34]